MKARAWIGVGFLVLLPAAAGGQGVVAAASPRTLAVVGEAQVTAAPDLAVLAVAVETEAAQAAAAAGRNAELSERVLRAVRGAMGERGEASTASYALFPVYTDPSPERPGDPPAIRAYRASNEVRVEVRDLPRVGPVLDAAVSAGANRVSSLQFSLERQEPHVRAALAEAGREARAEAEAAATALGVRLGAVLSARTGDAEPPPMPVPQVARMAIADGSFATPIEPGDVTVRVTLHVTYAID
jgi:uncharacterized protein YggE